jgi:protein-L-isoaspartate O-methyltransferase
MRLESFTPKNLAHKARVMLDRFHGLDFLTVVQSEEVGLDPNVAYRSTPSGGKYLANVLRDLNITPEDSIVDIGCGKGNAMRTMLGFPFARVDGIELSEQIAAIARQNFKRLNAGRVKLFVRDASLFHDYDPYNMVYFYNPFSASVMKQVVEILIQSCGRVERELVIIYNNATCHEAVVARGTFKKISVYPNEGSSGITIYTNRNSGQDRLSTNRSKQRIADGSGFCTNPALSPSFVTGLLAIKSLRIIWDVIRNLANRVLFIAIPLVLVNSDALELLDTFS